MRPLSCINYVGNFVQLIWWWIGKLLYSFLGKKKKRKEKNALVKSSYQDV